MDKEGIKKAISKIIKREAKYKQIDYALKDLTAISMFLQDLGRERWPDTFLDIFVLGELIEEIKKEMK